MNLLTFAPMSTAANIVLPKIGTLIPNRIFVGGITSTTTEEDLMKFFGRYGPIRDVKVIYDRSGMSKGSYGFVTFENQEIAEMIIKNEAESLTFNDRKINIGYAVRKQHIFTRQEGNNPLILTNSPISCSTQKGISLLPLNGHDYSCIGHNFKNMCSTAYIVPQSNSHGGSNAIQRNFYNNGIDNGSAHMAFPRNDANSAGVYFTESTSSNRMGTTIIPPGSLLYTHSHVVLPNGPGLQAVEVVSPQSTVIFPEKSHYNNPNCDAVSLANRTRNNAHFSDLNSMNNLIYDTCPTCYAMNSYKHKNMANQQKIGMNNYRVSNLSNMTCGCTRADCQSNATTVNQLKMFTQCVQPTQSTQDTLGNEMLQAQNMSQQLRRNVAETENTFTTKYVKDEASPILGVTNCSQTLKLGYDREPWACSQQTKDSTTRKSDSENLKNRDDENPSTNGGELSRNMESTINRITNYSSHSEENSVEKCWYNTVVLSSLEEALGNENIWRPREQIMQSISNEPMTNSMQDSAPQDRTLQNPASNSRWPQPLGQDLINNFDQFPHLNQNEDAHSADQFRNVAPIMNDFGNISNNTVDQITENLEKLHYSSISNGSSAFTKATPSGDTKRRSS